MKSELVEITLPIVWQVLLARPLTQDTPKARDTKLDDPLSYCDDCREVTNRVGEVGVTAKLCSGQTNYWLEWEVWAGGEWHHFDEVDYEIPQGTEVFYPFGNGCGPVLVHIHLV